MKLGTISQSEFRRRDSLAGVSFSVGCVLPHKFASRVWTYAQKDSVWERSRTEKSRSQDVRLAKSVRISSPFLAKSPVFENSRGAFLNEGTTPSFRNVWRIRFTVYSWLQNDGRTSRWQDNAPAAFIGTKIFRDSPARRFLDYRLSLLKLRSLAALHKLRKVRELGRPDTSDAFWVKRNAESWDGRERTDARERGFKTQTEH